MSTFFRFLYEILSQFFSGFKMLFVALYKGAISTFDIPEYIRLVDFYKNDFSGGEWLFVALTIIVLLVTVAALFFFFYFVIRKYVRFRKTIVEQESLLEEINKLNKQVTTLMSEKETILGLKASNLGLEKVQMEEEGGEEVEEGEESSKEKVDTTASRFPKLTQVDNNYAAYKVQNYGNTFDLPELVQNFRNFAAFHLKLFYKTEMIRLFISALSSTKLVILQGISGTGKTSLAYAWGKFLKHDSCVASVQPSWRDRTELFGYFNEFTKKFNETDVLRELYTAGYTDDIYTVILDEMNISRVEYYFAEMLSILEMPNKDEWIVELVSSGWDDDPKNIKDGKLHIPANVWYIGTINNDDSTFMVTDKVYDRAMPLDINDKGQVFDAIDIPAQDINYTYLDQLFAKARDEHPISEETIQKINEMDDYVIKHFRIAFGNRIVAHMKKFAPVYVGCGGDEIDAIDYFIARKILRKFEQLNISYIRDEIDGYIEFLDKTFGKGKMKECEEYLLRLKKLT